MPRIVCHRCKNRYNVTPSSMAVDGFRPLCAKCRRDIAEKDDFQYMCIAITSTGKRCRQIKRHGSDTCWHH